MQDRRTNSWLDFEKQSVSKDKLNSGDQNALGNITLRAVVDQEIAVASEIHSAIDMHEDHKDVSDDDNCDSSIDQVRRRRPSDSNHDYDRLMLLPCSALHGIAMTDGRDACLVLMKILEMVFQAKNVSESDLKLLNNCEVHLLSAFFSKKCKVNFSKSDDMNKVAEMINCHKSSYKHKRNEENYKLVFKKAIKHLTKTLKKEHPEIKSDKKKLLLAFYKKYFKDEFVKQGLDREYELPRNDQDKLVKNFAKLIYNPKTVNPRYISMVANSRQFIDDVVDFINNHFMRSYIRSRHYKVERILDNCRDLVKSVAVTGKVKDLRDRIENNPRFKLPWYNDELIKAIKCVKGYLTSKCNVDEGKFTSKLSYFNSDLS